MPASWSDWRCESVVVGPRVLLPMRLARVGWTRAGGLASCSRAQQWWQTLHGTVLLQSRAAQLTEQHLTEQHLSLSAERLTVMWNAMHCSVVLCTQWQETRCSYYPDDCSDLMMFVGQDDSPPTTLLYLFVPLHLCSPFRIFTIADSKAKFCLELLNPIQAITVFHIAFAGKPSSCLLDHSNHLIIIIIIIMIIII